MVLYSIFPLRDRVWPARLRHREDVESLGDEESVAVRYCRWRDNHQKRSARTILLRSESLSMNVDPDGLTIPGLDGKRPGRRHERRRRRETKSGLCRRPSIAFSAAEPPVHCPAARLRLSWPACRPWRGGMRPFRPDPTQHPIAAAIGNSAQPPKSRAVDEISRFPTSKLLLI